MKFFQLLLLLSTLVSTTTASSILGIDVGSNTLKVGLVSRGSPLQIVTNLHSKRKTENLLLFDDGSRFFGADASSLLTRKGDKAPMAMNVVMGRNISHPSVEKFLEKSFPVPLKAIDTTNVDDDSVNQTTTHPLLEFHLPKNQKFTPEELQSMVFSHILEFTQAFIDNGSSNPPKEVVLTTPMFYTQNERLALISAAKLADLNVLALIEENTASALNFGMDRVSDKDETILFFNMGATATQVSVIKFSSYVEKDGIAKNRTVPTLEVLGKGWDASFGGDDFDEVLVNYFADHFDETWAKKDKKKAPEDSVRQNSKAMSKLRLQAIKTKEVLSANSHFPIFIEGLYKDIDFKLDVQRSKFEEMAKDLFDRVCIPVQQALLNANMEITDVDAIELIGGGMRVPGVQKQLKECVGKGGLELGLHINSDESMALGAAFHGANISTAFRVRKVGLSDLTVFEVGVKIDEIEREEKKSMFGNLFNKDKKKEDGASDEEEVKWSKNATIFKSGCKLNVKKTIAFTHDEDITVGVKYNTDSPNLLLPKGTEPSIVNYNVTGIHDFTSEMQKKKGLEEVKPKVTMQFELSSSGIVKLVKAEAVVEEIIQVEVDEKVEVFKGDEEWVEPEVVIEEEKKEEEEVAESTDADAEAADESAAAEDETATDEEKTDEEKTDEETSEEDEKTKKDEEFAKIKKEKAEKKAAKEKRKAEKKAKEAAKEAARQWKTVTSLKDKKKNHKRSLTVSEFYTGAVRPISDEMMEASFGKLDELAKADALRRETEEAKNTLEAYIYSIKGKLEEDSDSLAELSKVSSEEQRTSLRTAAENAEEWLYEDGYDANATVFNEKYEELLTPSKAMFLRLSELEDRPKAVAHMNNLLEKTRALLVKWETSMPQVTEEERAEAYEKIEKVEKWLAERVEEQGTKEVWEEPAFFSRQLGGKTKSLDVLMTRLSKKPKLKEKKNETVTTDDEAKKEGEEEESLDDNNAGEEGESAETETSEESAGETEKSEEKVGGDEL